LTVLPGIEVQSREEVHLLCLFDTLEQALAWQTQVLVTLPDRKNDDAFFGAQFVVDATGEVLRTEERLLSGATGLSVEEIVAGVRALGGIVIPAHVDRPSFSLLANLGFVPQGLNIAGLELSRHAEPIEVARRLPQTTGYGQVVGGDAHRLHEMTARTMLRVIVPSVAEIALALAHQEGRCVYILPETKDAGCPQLTASRCQGGNA
jgi:hypothetical protein